MKVGQKMRRRTRNSGLKNLNSVENLCNANFDHVFYENFNQVSFPRKCLPNTD